MRSKLFIIIYYCLFELSTDMSYILLYKLPINFMLVKIKIFKNAANISIRLVNAIGFEYTPKKIYSKFSSVVYAPISTAAHTFKLTTNWVWTIFGCSFYATSCLFESGFLQCCSICNSLILWKKIQIQPRNFANSFDHHRNKNRDEVKRIWTWN